MRSDLFYQTEASQALPLFLVTKAQWESKDSFLTDTERNLLATQQFKGKPGDIALITDAEGLPTKACIGAGDNNEVLAIAHAATRLPKGNYTLQKDVSHFALVTWALAQYRFDHYKKHEITPRVLTLTSDKLDAVKREAAAIFLVRDLINTPANAMGPKELSAVMANMANEFNAEFEEWVGDELLKANFPAIHTVGRAGANAPRLLSLKWGNANHPRVTLVGKGVCFDSGGLDIKPSAGMRLMKKDMGGAAQVLGLAQLLMSQQLPIQLHVLIPAVENVIGPDAFKPGDIITMRNGLTVEVDNTDAEGRLVLADALVKACEASPEPGVIFDFATLTGAARVAVGTEIAALFTNDDDLAAALAEASKEVNDPMWRLPLFTSYESMLDSSVADMANASSSPYAGAITAALFLKRFIPATIPWAHFDIMAWNVSSKPGKPEGGEAMGIRAIAYYLQNKYGS
ncbi:MAG: leucyl aminopeptidase family protein [Legionella sp.]|nr:leucyl aminopeptidase family protein [Legionella sp.]